jgi:hypothetical protein
MGMIGAVCCALVSVAWVVAVVVCSRKLNPALPQEEMIEPPFAPLGARIKKHAEEPVLRTPSSGRAAPA